MANEFSTQTVDATLAAVGHKTAHAGAGTSVVGWLMSSEAGILIGILIGIAGLLMQWHYSRKRDKREEAEHQLRMALRKDSSDHE
jgi:hypothetical protein